MKAHLQVDAEHGATHFDRLSASCTPVLSGVLLVPNVTSQVHQNTMAAAEREVVSMTETAVARPTVIRTSRGLSIAGTRITLYSIMDYLYAGWPPSFDSRGV